MTTKRWRVRPSRVGSPPDPRFSFANERTFLAWNRTALALIGGGLAASELLHFGVRAGRLIVALPLIGLGAVVGIAGLTRWQASELAMRRRTALPQPRLAPALLGAGISAIAVASVVLLIIGDLHR